MPVITLDTIERDAIMARSELRELLREAQTASECERIAERAGQCANVFLDVQDAAAKKSHTLQTEESERTWQRQTDGDR
jgi:hypothetical protein